MIWIPAIAILLVPESSKMLRMKIKFNLFSILWFVFINFLGKNYVFPR